MAVTRRAQELRAAGREIIDLGAGEPDFPSPAVAVEAAQRALAEGFTRYTPASGIPELRRAVAAHFQRRDGAPWEAADTLITVGAKAALFELLNVLLDEGDEAVLPTPAWVSFEAQMEFAGARVVRVPTSADDGFAIHAEPILAALTDRTRVVLVNSPSNPTGGTVAAGELRRIAEGCAERGVVLVADETYDRFVWEGEHASAARLARELPETVALVGSFSKTYSMTGWRLGYALGPRELVAKAGELQSHATSNPTSFAMKGALAALAGAEDDVERMIAEFARRREVVVSRLAGIPGMRCQPPTGAFYAFPHVAGCYDSRRQGSIALADFLLQEAGVAVVPGLAFGADEHIRISFACALETLETGLDRIAAALA